MPALPQVRSQGLTDRIRNGTVAFDRFIRYDAVVEYIAENPVKAGLCSNPEEWRWSHLGKPRERGHLARMRTERPRRKMRARCPRSQVRSQGLTDRIRNGTVASDRFIRDAKHYDAVVEYLAENPVKAGLCSNPEEWRWSHLGKPLGARASCPHADGTSARKMGKTRVGRRKEGPWERGHLARMRRCPRSVRMGEPPAVKAAG